MEPMVGKEVVARVKGILSEKHQVHGYSVDLSVRSIHATDPTGRVDFGGSEYAAAGKISIVTQRRTLEDKYSWWDLGRGAYFIEFNEALELAPDEFAVLEPDDRLLRAGASHPTVFLRGYVNPVETLLSVEVVRLQIKQNARVSRLRVFRMSGGAKAAKPAPASKKSGKKK